MDVLRIAARGRDTERLAGRLVVRDPFFSDAQSLGVTGRSLPTSIADPPFTCPEIATTSKPLSSAIA
jgi:hypothetical protein